MRPGQRGTKQPQQHTWGGGGGGGDRSHQTFTLEGSDVELEADCEA